MNSKILLVTLAVTLTASFSVFAKSDVCADPLTKICKETEVLRAQRDIYIKKIKAEISVESEKMAAPRIEEMKKNIPKIRFIKRAIQAYKIRNQEIMRAAKKRVVGVEEVVTNQENISLLKGYMNQVVEESNFDRATKNEMQSILKTIVIGNFSDYLERMGIEDNFILQILANGCGSDGLIDNAFATTIEKQRYVLVCPGFLITMTQTPDLKERFNSILHAISHEMGHHIDNSKLGNATYKPFMSCLANNYSDKFNKTDEDKKFCKKNEKDPAACNIKVIESHAGELVADAWGIKVLNLHARQQNYSFADTEQLLTNSWNKLCGSKDEGIHPAGDFRIGTLLKMNSDMSAYLACGNSEFSTKPACSFEGEILF